MMMLAGRTALCALACMLPLAAALDYAASGADLEEPPSVSSSDGTLITTLTLDEFRYEGPTTQMWTRAFNGALPGPTLRVRAGDTVKVTLKNELYENVGTGEHNTFHYPNTTNLHTHGLHVSSASPGDNVLLVVEPRASYEYIYNIPADHVGGTFWYHPHHHGSTALQVGGGAAGVIIVEDEPGNVPSAVLNMPEKVVLTQHVPLDTTDDNLRDIAATSNDELTTVDYNSDDVDLLLVNGQTLPKISLTAGKYTRMRFVHSSVSAALELSIAGCTLELLAKDGVYLPTAPRTVTTLSLAPGARCDVALLCAAAGTFNLESGAKRRRQLLQGPGGGGGPGGDGPGGDDAFTGTIATIEVAADVTNSPDAPLASFQAVKPDYLADVWNLPASQVTSTHDIAFRGGANTGGCTVNGNSWVDAEASIDHELTVGGVHEYTLSGSEGHPFHLHINSFQLVAVTGGDTEYFQAGDWHDVLQQEGTVRFQTADFTGKAVIHCHILVHEDQGCMTTSVITGTEGTPASVASAYTTTFPIDAAPTPTEAAATPTEAAATPTEAAATPTEASATPTTATPTEASATPTEVAITTAPTTAMNPTNNDTTLDSTIITNAATAVSLKGMLVATLLALLAAAAY